MGQGRGGRELARATGHGRRRIGKVLHRRYEGGPDGPGDRRRRSIGTEPLPGAEDAEPPSDGGPWTGPELVAWMTVRLSRRVWPQPGGT